MNPLFAKEIRELAPVFLGTAAFILACGASGASTVSPLGVVAYALGAIVLGSLVVGQEYTHDTLGHVLAQPSARGRLVRYKLATLIALLGALWAITMLAVPGAVDDLAAHRSDLARSVWQATALLVPPLLALSVAPWLSMKCGSTLAAAVFTLALYAVLWSVTRAIAPTIPSTAPGFARTPLLIPVALLVAGGAVVAPWRSFMRLEARGRHVAFTFVPARRSTAASSHRARTGRPLRALIAKELRLQQTTFIVSALYVSGWLIVTGTTAWSPHAAGVFAGVTLLFRGVLAILAGALASAEERASDTLALQTLQPYPVWKQWAVKVAVVLTMTFVLAGSLPSALDLLQPSINGSTWYGVRLLSLQRGSGIVTWFNVVTFSGPGLLATLTLAALYVSTVCRTGLNALLMSSVFAGVFIGISGILSPAIAKRALDPLLFDLLHPFGVWAQTRDPKLAAKLEPVWASWWWQHATDITIAVHAFLAVTCLAPLLITSMRNHRTSRLEPAVVGRQVGWLAGWMMACALAAGAFGPLLVWSIFNLLRQ